jgi:hypothetical protein
MTVIANPYLLNVMQDVAKKNNAGANLMNELYFSMDEN